MSVLWTITVLCALSIVYAAGMESKLTDLLVKGEIVGKTHTNDTICHLKQTMAWAECGHHINCPSSCQGQDDCTFPYCTSQGRCACRNAFCRDDEMCHFFRIACITNFTCRKGKCYCDNVQTTSELATTDGFAADEIIT